MGREIRRVAPGWEHPRNERGYQPLFDRDFAAEAREWLDKAIAWDKDEDPDCAKYKADNPFYWQWAGDPPDPKYYRPKWETEPTHYQVYETVSEGTPVTPAFATKEELVEHLVQHGTEWDERGWDRRNAEQFVEREHAPSMIIAGGVIYTPRDGNPFS